MSSFDRLSGLFGRRKTSTASDPEPPISIPETHFPPPSFIRPGTSRMEARDESPVSPKAGARRARSLPEARVPERSSSLKFGQQYRAQSLNSRSRRGTPSSSARNSSLASEARERETIVSTLRRFMFPAPPRRGAISGESGHMAYTLPPSPRRSFDGSPHGSPRADTPTSFVDAESKTSPSAWLNFVDHNCPALAPPIAIFAAAPPTPEKSPCITPIKEPKKGRRGAVTAESSPVSNNSRFSSRDSLTLPPALLLSSPLSEPDLDDFLSLSDDDIAEATPLNTITNTATTNTTAALAAITKSPSHRLYITPRPTFAPEPIHTHPAATPAAFEAARIATRIATRFKFDLVYVLNLWPEAKAPFPVDGRPTLPTLAPEDGMTGRLLAAYGLSSVDLPLNMSASSHARILQTPGWIEYCNQGDTLDAADDASDFARGYACSFYSGAFGHHSSTTSPNPVPLDQVDRGLVFAAYRRPRPDGADVNSSPAELADIRRCAEGLVEMLLDMDVVERRRSRGVGLSGPMPTRQPYSFF